MAFRLLSPARLRRRLGTGDRGRIPRGDLADRMAGAARVVVAGAAARNRAAPRGHAGSAAGAGRRRTRLGRAHRRPCGSERALTLAEAFAPAPADPRGDAMAAFLAANGWGGVAPAMLTGDASFRRYYRLDDGQRRAVLMDAPPPQEDVGPYVTVAGILRAHGFSAPEIYAEDRANGFLLIEDFGDDHYTMLHAKGADDTALYTL